MFCILDACERESRNELALFTRGAQEQIVCPRKELPPLKNWLIKLKSNF